MKKIIVLCMAAATLAACNDSSQADVHAADSAVKAAADTIKVSADTAIRKIDSGIRAIADTTAAKLSAAADSLKKKIKK